MGNPAGVRRDFQKLEKRRLLGARLLRQGVHPAEVARQVGVHRQSVSRWAAQLKQGGMRALNKAGHAGRRARLRPEDLRRIERGLKMRAAGSGARNWPPDFVACGPSDRAGMQVGYHPSQAWRILRQLGWSCQRPVGHLLVPSPVRSTCKRKRRRLLLFFVPILAAGHDQRGAWYATNFYARSVKGMLDRFVALEERDLFHLIQSVVKASLYLKKTCGCSPGT